MQAFNYGLSLPDWFLAGGTVVEWVTGNGLRWHFFPRSVIRLLDDLQQINHLLSAIGNSVCAVGVKLSLKLLWDLQLGRDI